MTADERAAASTARSGKAKESNANDRRNEQNGGSSGSPLSRVRAAMNITGDTTQQPAYVRPHFPTVTAAAVDFAPLQPAAGRDSQSVPHADRPSVEAQADGPELQGQPIDEMRWAQSASPIQRPTARSVSMRPRSQPECSSVVDETDEAIPADSPLPADKFTQPVPKPRPSPTAGVRRESAPRMADSAPKKSSTSPKSIGLWSQLSGSNHANVNGGTSNSSVDRRAQSRPTAAPISKDERVAARPTPNQTAPVTNPHSGGLFSGLARPFTVKTNEAPIRRPNDRQVAEAGAASGEAKSQVAESERVPSLLLPFYQTNNTPRNGQIDGQAQDLAHTVRRSTLIQQLSLSTDSELRSQSDASATPPATRDARSAGWKPRVPSELNPFKMSTYPEQSSSASDGVTPAAYLQEPGAAGSADVAEPGKLIPPGDTNSANGEKAARDENANGDNQNSEAGPSGKQNKKDEKLATADKLGEKPEDRSLEFLRAETVLLKPGKHQFDIGFMYAVQERSFPILFRNIDPANPVDDVHVKTTSDKSLSYNVDEARFKTRELEVPMQLRCGLTEHIQAFIGAPVGWSSTEVDLNHYDEVRNDGGLGDVYWGTTIQLHEAEADCPYTVFSGIVTAPSGGDPFTGVTGFAPSAPSMGNGFWRVAGNLLFIQPLDPVTFFYGVGIRGSFDHEYIGANFQPGMEYNYTFGMGFAVNEKVTFSSQLFGEYQTELRVNGQNIDGSAQEPISLQLAATIARPCEHYVQPFIQFGVTRDAPSVNLGITWTY